jgi:hypothetical protein
MAAWANRFLWKTNVPPEGLGEAPRDGAFVPDTTRVPITVATIAAVAVRDRTGFMRALLA